MTKKKNKASVLIVALIILGVILVTTLSISLVAVRERKASIGSSTTNVAYQNAETGIEAVMNAILNKGYTTAGQVCSVLTKSGVYTASLVENVGSTEKTLDACGADTAEPLSNVASIKSVGNDATNQEQRAIEAAVAAGPVFSKIYNVTSSRQFGTAGSGSGACTSYQNISGKPMSVSVTALGLAANSSTLAAYYGESQPSGSALPGGGSVAMSQNGALWNTISFIVPAYYWYCVIQWGTHSGAAGGVTWFETY